MPITASSAVKTRPNLCPTSRRSSPASARAGFGLRASGLRGVPSATASTRWAWSRRSAPGGSSRGSSWSSVRPQTTAPGATSSGRATYRVRRCTRTWLGAGWSSAAATNDGADIAVPDSTVQSGNSIRMWSPRRRLKMASTSRSPGFSSCARSPACRLPTSSCQTTASARADCTSASVKAWLDSSGYSSTRTRGSALICGPWWFRRSGRMTVTCSPYREVSSSVMRYDSGPSPQTMRWSPRRSARRGSAGMRRS